ncbi:hypothetical protein E8E14_012255 [Neopestalotiopsis sp. 37M]|nr:hypothetical protein E8E14_012255 [Neopestalotiopsis sp. 37M]
MARLLCLPDELLSMIGDYCDHVPDLCSLSSTCRQFHHIFDPLLYKAAARDYPHLLTWACDTSQLSVVKKLLDAEADPNKPCAAVSPRWEENYSKRVRELRITPKQIDLLKAVYNHSLLPRRVDGKKVAVQTAAGVVDIYDDEWDSDISADSYNSRDSTYRDKTDGLVYFRSPAAVCGYSYEQPTLYDQNPDRWTLIGQQFFWFPLHAAASNGSLEVVKLLIDAGALLEPPSQQFCSCQAQVDGQARVDINRWIPLHTALCSGNDNVACYLITLGSSFWLNEWHTSTALHQAAELSQISVLQALYDKDPGINLNKADASMDTPIMYAHRSKRSTETILWFIEHGLDPNVRCGWKRPTPYELEMGVADNSINLLQTACIFGRFKLAVDYIHAGARCDSTWQSQSESKALTPLERCCTTRRPPVPELSLVCHFKSQATRDAAQEFPYISAADSEVERAKLVALMIEKGAKISRLNPEDGSFESLPMILAAQHHLIYIMEILLKAGAGVADTYHGGKFPLCAVFHVDYAAQTPHSGTQAWRTIGWLLDHGADINQTSGGHQALFCLCNRPGHQTAQQIAEQLELARLLIDRGVIVDSMVIRNDLPEPQHYSSALEAAFRHGRLPLCDLLVQNGAVFPRDADSLQRLLQLFLSNHKPIFSNENYVPNGYSHGFQECIERFGPEWRNWSDDEKLAMLLGLRKQVFDGLEWLHSHDTSHALAKHPRSLWLAANVPRLPLIDKFLEAGASDASWVEEGRDCLDQLSQDPVSLSRYAEKFVARGAGPPRQSLLYYAIAGRKQFEDTQVWPTLQVFFSNGVKLDLCNQPADNMWRHGPLFYRIKHSMTTEADHQGLELVLRSLSRPISETPDQGYEALSAACDHPMRPRVIKILIVAGVDVNYAPPGRSTVSVQLVLLFRNLLEYLDDERCDEDSLARLCGVYEPWEVEERIHLGEAGDMLDALKVLIDNGTQIDPLDPSLAGLYDTLQKIAEDDRETWSEIRDLDDRHRAAYFVKDMRVQIRERVFWEDEKLSVRGRQ